MKAAEKKDPTFKDVRGNTVASGSRVIYNYSGDVASGTVVKITGSNVKIERDPEWTTQFQYVKNVNGKWDKVKPDIITPEYSNVKNRRGILAVHENTSIRDQINFAREEAKAAYERSLEEHKQRLAERERSIEERTTELIRTVVNAWDLDEVKDKLVELFGEDVLKQEDEVPDWLAEALNGKA